MKLQTVLVKILEKGSLERSREMVVIMIWEKENLPLILPQMRRDLELMLVYQSGEQEKCLRTFIENPQTFVEYFIKKCKKPLIHHGFLLIPLGELEPSLNVLRRRRMVKDTHKSHNQL